MRQVLSLTVTSWPATVEPTVITSSRNRSPAANVATSNRVCVPVLAPAAIFGLLAGVTFHREVKVAPPSVDFRMSTVSDAPVGPVLAASQTLVNVPAVGAMATGATLVPTTAGVPRAKVKVGPSPGTGTLRETTVS